MSPPRAERTRVQRWLRRLIILVGLGCIAAGILVVVLPLVGVWQRGNNDQSALNAWLNGGSSAAARPVAGTGGPANLACGTNDPSNYALVRFKFVAPAEPYNYAGVAGNGNWSLLDTRSMVHWAGSAAPGGIGNMIIAFHREPDYQYINQLGIGDEVTVEDHSCTVYTYRITHTWTLSPSNVTQLGDTTSTGHELTMITCTPFWVDNQRIVWRAVLVSTTAPSPSPATS